MRAIRSITLLLLPLCFVLLLLIVQLSRGQECDAQNECEAPTEWQRTNVSNNGEEEPSSPCGLYMAESSIPDSGWGIYTGIERRRGEVLNPVDVQIQVAEQAQTRLMGVPRWLMYHYVWEADESWFDATYVDSISPGFGMLANSHMGLVNAKNEGTKYRKPIPRYMPEAGAFSHYQNLTFTAKKDVAAGHEIFVSYSDSWFEERSEEFGEDLPLSGDFKQADRILKKWNAVVDGDLESPFAKDMHRTVIDIVSPFLQPRVRTALPKSHEQAVKAARNGTAAYLTVPNVVRSLDWLEEHGICLDNIIPDDSTVTLGKGIFATRYLTKGSIVAPAPLIHLSRRHMEMVWKDKNKEIVWKGHQLLLNYCYGHPSSSLIFFPYSPAINLINHNNTHPNVALRWSPRMSKPELLNMTSKEVIAYNKKAGLMMEIYALRGIRPGEEILLDYGEEWQQAWENHVARWRKPVHADDYVPAWFYNNEEEAYTEQDLDYPPSYVEVRCFVDQKTLRNSNEDGWLRWKGMTSDDLEEAIPCRIIDAEVFDEDDEEVFYRVVAKGDRRVDLQIMDVPRKAITFFEKPYTGNQFLRQAFRHEIMLPDDMVPANWRDLETHGESCGLYMAESTIPDTGLGVFTARDIQKDRQITNGDLVIQVENNQDAAIAPHWYYDEFGFEEKAGMLEQYLWNATTTNGEFEADDVSSLVPGLGMLANSHPRLVNADMVAPSFTTDLHRGKDPGAGASTNYHGVYFKSRRTIKAGEEIFIQRGGPGSFNGNGLPKTAGSNPPDVTRSLRWLEENGRCLDNIKPAASKIRQAGRGAFATRPVKKGEVVAPMPMAHVQRQNLGTCNSGECNRLKSELGRPNAPLLLNYCYGHPASSLLLFPYSPVVNYVNHNATAFNAELRWSSLQNHRTNWLQRSPDDLVSEEEAGLIMELVATRDIERGEEVYLNYGEEWDRAWNLYVREQWDPSDEDKEYVPAEELNGRVEWVRTRSELRENPYDAAAAMTICYVGPNLKVPELASYEGPQLPRTTWKYGFPKMYQNTMYAYPCEIESRSSPPSSLDLIDSVRPENVAYTAVVHHQDGDVVVSEIPRKAIRFVDSKYSSDMFLRTAFRHEIQIPDHMIPPAWRDLRE